MNQSTLSRISISFNHLNHLASQLRQAGAKFNVTGQGEVRHLNFRTLPETAQLLITELQSNDPLNFTEMSEDVSSATVEIEEDIQINTSALAPTVAAENQSKNLTAIPSLNHENNTVKLSQESQKLDSGDSIKTEKFASFEQLILLEKKTLKILARDYKIQGRSKMNVEALAKSLANKVPTSSL